MRCASLRACTRIAVLLSLIGAGCRSRVDQQTVRPLLRIANVEILTQGPQVGHPIEVRTLIEAEEEVEDVGITYYLEEDLGPGAQGVPRRTVLDSVVEAVVPASIESEVEPGTMVDHELVAKMTVPTHDGDGNEVQAGTYFVYASIELLPFNEADPEIEDYDGRLQDCKVVVGDDLKNTPDLVIDDVRAKTEVVLLTREEPNGGAGDDDPPDSHWTGTVLITSFGGSQTEGATISALLEIPGRPLRPIKIWNTHEYVQVWRNDGKAVFEDTLQRLRSTVANDVELADLDGDGDLDLIAANGNPEEDDEPKPNRIWLNDGTGSYVDSGQKLGESYTFGIAVGDVDGDGDLDIVTGNADGDQGQPDRVWINEGGRGLFSAGAELGAGNTYAVRLGDIDGDGDLDLVAAGDETRIWTNDGQGNFVDSGVVLDTGRVRDLAIGDLDGNGDPDLVAGGETSAIWNNDGGVFTRGADLGDLLSVALGDLDLDRDLDLLTGSAGGGVSAWRNQSGALEAAGGPFGSAHAYDLAIGDLNGDGLPDFAAGNDGDGVAEADRIWLSLGADSLAQFNFEPGQELGGSDTRAVALGNIDADTDLDLVSGNLGLPDRIEGNYVDDLEIAALKPNTPTRIQIDLHIPQFVDGVDIYTEIDDYVQASGSVYFDVLFCIDRFDDIPEHEGSSFDPKRPNDNCIEQRLIILPPPPPGEKPGEVTFSNDSDATWGGKFIGIGVAGHFEGKLTKSIVQQRVEQSVPFTLFGWTLDIMRLTSDASKVPGKPEDALHDLDLEFAGITIFSQSGEGAPVGEASEDTTEDVVIELTFSVCLPPPIFELKFISEEFNFGATLKKKEEEEKKTGETGKTSPPNDDASDPDDTADGEKPDDEVAKKKKSEVKEGVSGDFDCGWVKVIPVGPIPLTIRMGATGKIGFKVTLNEPQRIEDQEEGLVARVEYKFEPVASADGFVFLGLELSLGILKARAGVVAKLLVVEYGYEVLARSLLVHNEASPTASGVNIYDTDVSFTVTEIFRSLRGEVLLIISIEIKADIGLFELKVSWKFEKSLFKFKGIEQKDILAMFAERRIARISTFD